MHIWHIRVLGPDACADIVGYALSGNQEAVLLLSSCANGARKIGQLTTPDPAALSCLICNAPLWQGHLPMAIVVAGVYDDVISAPSTFGVCSECFVRHRDQALKNAVLAGYGARLGEPLRQLPPLVATAGHA
jgi:hypothetical protein